MSRVAGPAQKPEDRVFDVTAASDGSWSIEIDSPADSGIYEVTADCLDYTGTDGFFYGSTELLVSQATGFTLTPDTAAHFDRVDFTSSGFTPGENVRIEFRQNGKVVEALDPIAADQIGELTGYIELGNSLAPGDYDVVLVGEESGVELTAQLRITGDDEGGATTPQTPGVSVPNTLEPVVNNVTTPAGTAGVKQLATTGAENTAPGMLLAAGAALVLGAGAVALSRRRVAAGE